MTVPRLFYFPRTRATRARWMLEELDLGYDLISVDFRSGAQRQAAYRAIHPLGKVPALEIDGATITESLAICLYLADRYWEKDLAPVQEERALRAVYLSWMALSTGTLEPALIEIARHRKTTATGLTMPPVSPAMTPWEDVAVHFELTLKGRAYLVGDSFSAADIMNGSMMIWARSMDLTERLPNTNAWLERLTARPAYHRATMELEQDVPA